MRSRPAKFLLAIVLATSTRWELYAQTTTSGALTGVVTDQTHAVVPDVLVEIKNIAKGVTQPTKTDREGLYRFFFLAPGRYTLTVSHDGFREERRTVDVLLGPPITVNVSLEVATANSEIRVSDEVPLLQAEDGDFSTAINWEQISDLPNSGNDLTYIAQTAPGVVMNTDGGAGNFSSLGMPATSNLFTLNGMNDNDMGLNLNQTGPLGPMLGQNEIQEATVITNGYSGQFGTLAGTNVNYITKSGSNGFHGNAKYFWNGRVLNANDWINKASGQPRPFAIANQWAGSVGGPLKKDKLFFFFNAEGLHLTLPLIFPTVVPSTEFEVATMANIDNKFGPTSASHDFYQRIFDLYNTARGTNAVQPGGFFEADKTGCGSFNLGGLPCAVNFIKNESQPLYESLISGRVDWNATNRDRLFLLVQYDHGINRFVDPISPLFNIETDQPWWQGQLVQTHTFGVSAANQFVLSGWWRSAIFKPKNLAQTQAAFPTRLGWCDGGSCSFNNLGLSLGAPVGSNNTQWQIADDLSGIRGSHKLGIGVNFLRVDHNDFFYGGNSAGDILPFSLDAFYQGGFDANGGPDDFTALSQSFAQARSQRVAFYNLGVYAQDDWRARPNLAFTLALRIEHQSNPVCADRCFARLAGPFESVSHDPNQPYSQAILINQRRAYPDLNSILWAPRISLAWQPFGVLHNMVLRGGIGIFYDSLPGALAEDLTVNPPLNNQFSVFNNNIAPGETNSLFLDAKNSNTAFLNAFSGGETFSQIQKIPGFSPPSFINPGRTTLSPQYQKWSLELQQVFGINTSLSIGYFGNHGIHEVIQNTSANAYGFGSLPQSECTSPPVPPCADPRFSTVNTRTSVGVSNYHGVVTSFKHRFAGRTQGLLQANYTYGRAFDEGSNGGLFLFVTGAGGYAINPQDPNNPRGSYGPADYDTRHSFNANYLWEIPVKTLLGNRGPDYLVTGWQISGTIFARGGFRYTVYENFESGVLSAKNFAGQLYAVPAHPLGKQLPCGGGAVIPAVPQPCQTPLTLSDGTPNPAADFIQSGCITDFNSGNLPDPSDPSGHPCGGPAVNFAQGRNRFHGPSYFSADLTIMKNTRLPGWDTGRLGIGFQFFNVFNHPNFGMPDGFSSAPTFGQIIYTASPPTGVFGRGVSARMIQVKAQLQF